VSVAGAVISLLAESDFTESLIITTTPSIQRAEASSMRHLTDDDLRKLTPAKSATLPSLGSERSNPRYGYVAAASTP